MGDRPCTATQWDAARRALEGEPPPRVLIAAAMGMDATALDGGGATAQASQAVRLRAADASP